MENVQLTCIKTWKGNLKTYFELKRIYFVAMHTTIFQVICSNSWILAILGNIEHIRIFNVLKLTLTLDLNFHYISNRLCIRYILLEIIKMRSDFGFWNILETFLAKHHQYEIQSTYFKRWVFLSFVRDFGFCVSGGIAQCLREPVFADKMTQVWIPAPK